MASITVFLSHVREESKLADIIERHIEEDFIGLVRVFASSDHTSILAGSKWFEEVTTALREAHVHIVLASPDSIERKWINFEAGAAHIRGVPIVPVCHSGLTPGQLPVPLSESQGIELSTYGGFEQLYQAIARPLGSNVPRADFKKYSAEVSKFEQEYASRVTVLVDSAKGSIEGTETVRNPTAICVSSNQFVALGMAKELEQVLAAFPSNVNHDKALDSMDLRRKLTSREFQIVHVASFVCPRSGALYFSDVDLHTGRPVPGSERDVLSADDFAALLRGAGARLVVITSSDSLALATSLLTTCHVVAARDLVSSKMMAAWVGAFYQQLARGSLSSALEVALKASGAPMRLYSQLQQPVDLVVERHTSGEATTV